VITSCLRACVLSLLLGCCNLLWADAPALLLARVHDSALDPSPYWVSEKYDGVRAYWDGKALYFRSGNPVAAPEWFVRDFPPTPLDGELWLGRGRFQELVATVRRQQPVDGEWRQVRYMVFELPDGEGDFTARLTQLGTLIAQAQVPWLQLVAQFRVPDSPSLLAHLQKVVQVGGEGLMLHRADAAYVTGRSDALLKLTPERDAEATVVGHVPGKGKLQGVLGALKVRTPEGREFRIGTGFTMAERQSPPSIGSQVTYRYRELTRSGLPRFPRYLRPYEPL